MVEVDADGYLAAVERSGPDTHVVLHMHEKVSSYPDIFNEKEEKFQRRGIYREIYIWSVCLFVCVCVWRLQKRERTHLWQQFVPACRLLEGCLGRLAQRVPAVRFISATATELKPVRSVQPLRACVFL